MRIPTQNQWRYQGLVESLVQIIKRDSSFISQPELLEELLLHAFDKVYKMGQIDPATIEKNVASGIELGIHLARPLVSVIDLSNVPEIFERARDRWREGICH